MSNSVGSPRKSLKEKLVSQNECLIGVMYVRSYFEYGFSDVPLLYQRLFFFFFLEIALLRSVEVPLRLSDLPQITFFSIFILYFFRENGLIFKSVAPVYRFREGESPLSRPDF